MVIDDILVEDKNEKGYTTEGALELEQLRLFAYSEYLELFNDKIEEYEYQDLPVYFALGIDSEKKQASFKLRYDKSLQSYRKAIDACMLNNLLEQLCQRISEKPLYLPLTDKVLPLLLEQDYFD